MGDPDAPKNQNTLSDNKAAGPAMPDQGSEQPVEQGETALQPSASPPDADTLGSAAPRPKHVADPLRRKGGSKVAAFLNQPARTAGHYAKIPGPDASRDEYLHYLSELVFENRGLLSADILAGRTGGVVLDILVRRSGAIVWIKVDQSSGFPDIDKRVIEMVDRVDAFPPIPSYIDGPTWKLTLTMPFPVPDEVPP
jgi:TonB family protein